MKIPKEIFEIRNNKRGGGIIVKEITGNLKIVTEGVG
jgi:hypothetical protein